MKKLLALFIVTNMLLSGCTASSKDEQISSRIAVNSTNSEESAVSSTPVNSSEADSTEQSTEESTADNIYYDETGFPYPQPLDAQMIPKEYGTYEPSELLGWQEDPFKDGLVGNRLVWEHLEYRTFGKPEEYYTWKVESCLINLPPDCFIMYDIIEYDAGFAREYPDAPKSNLLKMGEFRGTSKSGGFDSIDMDSLFLPYFPNLKTVETQDNVPGGVYRTEKFFRCIEPRVDNILLQYYVKVSEDSLTHIYFFVSAQATADDLMLYDVIADSIRLDV